MTEDIKEVILTEDKIGNMTSKIGEKISNDYKGKDLVLIGILKGSVMFMCDLMKKITIPCSIDFMVVSSYGNATESTGKVKILKDIDFSIEGKDILIVEDIIDSGITLSYVKEYLYLKKPRSLEIVTLLNKPERRKVNLQPKYMGFNIPDAFLVGYGLDFAEKYRNLPYIGVLKEEVYK
ncbi:hypoxanthine-guanine phosphoribosyltransferase [Clostridium pasteurianum DSM 525 = ATCC 6013]|uniref:Hypoxanthine phosphoribosyltransferase n=1 Tax=Clostridium pasteurianum DSM 525 = ATCC 6013 TaxID=1262449 RepID=A0A0H3J934_CLOPA|nr:hypoxanthine phosphoribosyltransferase [Clostridium pasteurianum]AJA49772.1 hypoxanthine-guanine phosphoribosyltransferase [Clostridium pasteurianum DSM 525 = ATCC 6013]AJA53760.1 hypoxanthine-guanine phosphoribosyltransferase [Clostridium pasteurianum DSM 525 = ATCC 6013]AOZ76923.1 hypoxanthine phosphoribosyltransferase [Clostridium pasteurianum DSM 525 = ATCC 6013]AOZ80720.1 hypoxanthine phosphoribosyltransferase [Clostridium pasteurianum]ELP57721.1 hypoxanthine phosphoribosyltransferase 